LGQLPRLGWLVVTDEATVGDLTADELEFRPHPGEHIELAQIRNRDGQVRVLRRLPAKGAMPLPVSKPGLHLLAAGDRLEVVVVVSVPARSRSKELHGGLAVAKTLDAAPVLKRLERLGVSASVNNASGTAWLGPGPRVQGRGTRAIELQSPAGKGTTILVAAPGMSWLRVMTWFLVLSTLVAAVVFWRRSGGSWLPARLPVPIPRQASWPEPPADDDSAADRTFDPDATTVQAPGLAPHATHARPRTGAVPLYPSPPHATGRPTPVPDPRRDEYRALFSEFVSLRRTTGESVDDIERDDFVEQLRRTRDEIMHRDGVQDVQFRLVFQNGKAVIRFTTVP
jgi:hypothetical protein